MSGDFDVRAQPVTGLWHAFRTKTELIAAVDNWMQFYNNRRRHSVIGMLAPITYERKLNAATQAT
jgi:putative transposase